MISVHTLLRACVRACVRAYACVVVVICEADFIWRARVVFYFVRLWKFSQFPSLTKIEKNNVGLL